YTTTTNVGPAFAGGTTGLYVGSGVAEHEEYVLSSEAETFRTLLANTGCFRVVAPGSPSDLVLVGQVHSVPNMGWTIPLTGGQRWTRRQRVVGPKGEYPLRAPIPLRPDGRGLRQLTDARGRTINADGSFGVEFPGPFAYSSGPR